MNQQRHNGMCVKELVQNENTSMNSNLKMKMHKGSSNKLKKTESKPKQETIKAIKVLQEVMTIME